MNIIPANRPRLTESEARKILAKEKVSGVAVIGIRGYYTQSMGDPTKNDRGIYDDALFIVSPDAFIAFNGNTDPSISRHRVAVLKEGVWQYRIGIHGLSKPKAQQYQAYVQAAPVTVIRDGVGPDTGWFGINIHRGGNNTTSSLGCQTIPPAQWESFRTTLNAQLKRHNQKTFSYILKS